MFRISFAKSARLLAGLAVVVGASVSNAGNIQAVPDGWRLQSYVGGTVAAYYTGSPCTSGSLTMTTATQDERNRFWTLVMTAKATGHLIGVYYDDSSCEIQSFYEV